MIFKVISLIHDSHRDLKYTLCLSGQPHVLTVCRNVQLKWRALKLDSVLFVQQADTVNTVLPLFVFYPFFFQ
jgi:hypothetical protein